MAGWGTEHWGVGRCRQHDIIPSSVQVELPAPDKLTSLASKFKQDKDPFELREEIATTRAAMAVLLDQIDNGDDTGLLRAIPALNMLLNTTGKLVQKLHDIEVGRKYVIRVDVVQQTMKQILAIVVEEIPDPRVRAEIAQRINRLEVVDIPSEHVTELTPVEQETTSLLRGKNTAEGDAS